MSESAEYTYFHTFYFDIIRFLEEYEKLPCLWDRNHKCFRDKNARVKAEESLGEKLGIADLKRLRRKIRSVRGTYNAEIRKIKLSLDVNEVHIPKLSWFSLADDFLRVTTDLPVDVHVPQDETEISLTHTQRKKTTQKLPRRDGVTVVMVQAAEEHTQNWENDEIRIESMDDNAFDDELELIDDGNPSKQSCDSSSSIAKFDTSDEYTSDLLGRRPSDHSDCPELEPSTRKKPKSIPDTSDTSLADVIKTLKDIQDASENEFAVFGRSIAVQLQNLPIEIASQLQADIQAHITRMRLDYIKSKV